MGALQAKGCLQQSKDFVEIAATFVRLKESRQFFLYKRSIKTGDLCPSDARTA